MTSIVPVPSLSPETALVFPNRHAGLAELTGKELAALMREVGRLAVILGNPGGYVVQHKDQPAQNPNGVTVPGHPHFHVSKREPGDNRLFPVPEPNSIDGMYQPTTEEIEALLAKLR